MKKILIGLVVIILIHNIYYFMPNIFYKDKYEVYEALSEGQVGIVYGNEYIKYEGNVEIDEDRIYVPVDVVKGNIDKYIFWDEEENKLIITTEDKYIKMNSEELTSYINNEVVDFNVPVKKVDGKPYLNINDFAELYNINVYYNSKENILVIDKLENNYYESKITKNTVVRDYYDRKGFVISKALEGQDIRVYKESNNYYFIRTEDGLLGFVAKNKISKPILIEGIKDEAYHKENKIDEGNITVVWHQINRTRDNKNKIPKIEGLDVISPTWFYVENTKGDIRSKADLGYVKDAHRKGYKVWGLITDSFNRKMIGEVLKSSEKREKLIKQLLVFSKLYDLDGINIDFEAIGKDTGEYYLQFIRELAPFMKSANLTLSVDMYVPSASTKHYMREDVSKVADYIMVMAYDEHWRTAPKSGSIASLPWVIRGIERTLDEVDSSKVILGVPFYTRHWQEKDGKIVENPAYSMGRIESIVKNSGATPVWNSILGQNYVEYNKNGITNKIWIEDRRSMELKLDLVKKYNLKGVAAWKYGLEKDEIWVAINEKIKKEAEYISKE
ncbi:MAG: glycosyl hydrolase family 18 protein [Clostridia bacterium]|nr:glycosyl hydrolase family 18 protein [Clostridia bacterium]